MYRQRYRDMKFLHLLVFVVFCETVSARRTGPCPLCGTPSNIQFVKIPKGITLSEFDTNWANEGKIGFQSYFAWPDPPAGVFFNSDTRFTKTGNNKYFREVVGSVPSGCIRLESEMTPVAGTNKAMFLAADWMQTYFSSCPSKYLWFVRCFNWVPGQRTCALNKTWIKLIVPTLDRTKTIPWEAVVKDLKLTGLGFGKNTSLNWVFGFGTTPANCSVTTPGVPVAGTT